MNKYTSQYDTSASPEDYADDCCYEVVYRLPWAGDRFLAPVARGCTKEDAERIAQALGRTPLSRDEILAIVDRDTVRWLKSDDAEIFTVRVARAIEEAHGIREQT